MSNGCISYWKSNGCVSYFLLKDNIHVHDIHVVQYLYLTLQTEEDATKPKKLEPKDYRKRLIPRTTKILDVKTEEKISVKEENISEIPAPLAVHAGENGIDNGVSSYEQLRLKNLQDNADFFAKLGITEMKTDIKQSLKPSKTTQLKSKQVKKEKTKAPPETRRASLRIAKMDPDGAPLPEDFFKQPFEPVEEHPRKPSGTLEMAEYLGFNSSDSEHDDLLSKMKGCFKCKIEKSTEDKTSFDSYVKNLSKLKINMERVAKVVPNRVFSLDIHPTNSKLITAAGDKWGFLGIWDVMAGREFQTDGVVVYAPHSRPINCLKFSLHKPNQLYSCSYDGTVRCCDLQKGVFDEIYSTPDEVLLKSFDFMTADTLLVAQQDGCIALVDTRTSSSSPPQEKETRSVSSQTEGQVTVITVGNPHNAVYPSGAVSVRHTAMSQSTISSQQSIPKSLRNSSSNTRHERPVSPASTILSDRLSLGSLLTVGSTQTGPPLLAEPIRDGIQHFCEKHMTSIRNFICQFSARIPIPAKCGIINGRHRQYIRLFFLCGDQKERCIYGNSYFTLDTKVPKTWIHLMFLAIQAQSTSALSQNDPSISSLKTCLEAISEKGQNIFLTIVTSSFPSAKDQDLLIQELNRIRFFDVFEFNAAKKHWACFVCNHPEKVGDLLQDGVPVIAGQLKEKKGKWKFLKRWKTRYFTLSGAHMTYNKSDHRKETLPVSKIQSVKAVRKGIRDIPKAFEIFTGDETYTFKAKGQQNIEQWVQCLHIAVAQVQNKDDEKKSTKMVPMPSHVNPLNQENVVIERPRSVMDTKL
ncbi:Hypothetical predicted protein [Mytilus galloprovincialis]|uniref:PH domain-containing protein n=1 Tax=Mytilus galloprovincialis TaxID=29158 RepID=A0A8B6BQ88_MYTGA|nr:Hypothetical predicted protein [Mytilus galloprovincialis]